MATTHACPGGCGAAVARALFACGACWRRLPASLRVRISVTYQHRLGGHREAMRKASLWFDANPRPRRDDVVWRYLLRGAVVHAVNVMWGGRALCGARSDQWFRAVTRYPECKRCTSLLATEATP